jgi:exodeoxyribonuclease V gamma subunit
MGFYFHAANRMESLAGMLCEQLLDRPAGSPLFAPETIVVSAKGMEQWLRFEIARRNGICANIEFLLLQKFAFNYLFDGAETPGSGSDAAEQARPEIIAWRIYQELGKAETAAHPAYAPLLKFIGQDPETAEPRRFALAGQIANLFDQYAVYRPDEVLRWQRGDRSEIDDWQPELWRQVFSKNAPHAANLCQEFMMRLEAGGGKITEKFKRRRVFFFGFSSMPPAYFVTLHAMGQQLDDLDVHFHYLSPCNDYWVENRGQKAALRDLAKLQERYPEADTDDDAGGNSLLGSLGRIGREFTKVAMDNNADTTGGNVPDDISDETPATVLEQLQQDILGNVDLRDQPEPLASPGPDDSVSFHSCHSPMREMEVLREYLLAAFAQDPALLPRDVIVMVADMAAYAPYIQAVFSGTGAGNAIPYSIADRSLTEEYPEIPAFLALLNLGRTRLSSEDLIAILNTPAIRTRFGIGENDFANLLPLLREAGATWGIDAEFRQHKTGIAFNENSWRFAFERLMLGYAMMPGETAQEALVELDGETPVAPLARGSRMATVAAAFMSFAEQAFELYGELSGGDRQRPGREWGGRLIGILDAFFDDGDDFSDGCQCIRRAAAKLDRQLGLAGLADTAIPPSVATAWLEEHLQGEGRGDKFLAGGVTFCKFQPMRGIPAKVIAMVGLSDGVFPRQDRRTSFDLLGKTRRFCDRTLKDDDRYAFLEALLAARRKIHISYVGRSAKDNKETPPSIVVGELLDYLQTRFQRGDGKEQAGAAPVVIKHPLHPFSPAYFTGKTTLVSYSAADHAICMAVANPGEHLPPYQNFTAGPILATAPVAATIDLDDLAAFFDSPCAALFRQLNIKPDLRQEELPDTAEPFVLDGLDTWKILDPLLQALRDDPATSPKIQQRLATARGQLPVGNCGQPVFDQCFATAKTLADAFHRETAGWTREPTVTTGEIPLDLGNGKTATVRFAIGDIFTQGETRLLVRMRPSRDKAKYMLRDRLHHLALAAAGLPAATCRLYKGSENGFAPLDPAPAQAELAVFAGIYLEGMTRPLCCWPPSVLAIVKKKEAEEEEQWKAAREKWQNDAYKLNPEATDTATITCFGMEMPKPDSKAWKELRELAEALSGSFPNDGGNGK